MPVGEFLNSKTMLTKILLTYTTKLNVAFIGLMILTNQKSRKYCRPANAIEQSRSLGGVSSLSLARRRHCPGVANKGSPHRYIVTLQVRIESM